MAFIECKIQLNHWVIIFSGRFKKLKLMIAFQKRRMGSKICMRHLVHLNKRQYDGVFLCLIK